MIMRREVVRMSDEMWEDLAFAIVTYTQVRAQQPDPSQFPKHLPSFIRNQMAQDRGVLSWLYRVAQRRLKSNKKFCQLLIALSVARYVCRRITKNI